MVQEGEKMNHVKAMTYAPKIPGVRDGTIRQTIRAGSKVSVGDTILFHGWKGRPYATKWSWRMRVTVRETILIYTYITGFQIPSPDGKWNVWHRWSSNAGNRLAKLDGVLDGKTLGELLSSMDGLYNDVGTKMQVIRW
jgi:hypothetical protein